MSIPGFPLFFCKTCKNQVSGASSDLNHAGRGDVALTTPPRMAVKNQLIVRDIADVVGISPKNPGLDSGVNPCRAVLDALRGVCEPLGLLERH